MLLTHKVKLLPTAGQGAALPETMERFNEACGPAAKGVVNGPIVRGIFRAILVHPRCKPPVSKGS